MNENVMTALSDASSTVQVMKRRVPMMAWRWVRVIGKGFVALMKLQEGIDLVLVVFDVIKIEGGS